MIFAPTSKSYTVTAVYSGDTVYSGSTSLGLSIAEGSSTTFTISSDPARFALASGDHKQISVSLASPNSFSDTVSLACLNLPANATCTFTKNQLTLAANSTATTQVVFDTGDPLGSGASARLDTGTTRRVVAAGFLLPLSAALGALLYLARRRQRIPALLALLLMAAAGMDLVGCGSSLNVSKTPPGSYTVQVVAHANGSGITQVASIAIQVQ